MMGDNNPPEALRRDNAVQTTYLLKFISYTPTALHLVIVHTRRKLNMKL